MKKLHVITPDASCDTCIGSCCAYFTTVGAWGAEIEKIATHLGISKEECYKQYTTGFCGDYGHVLRKDNDGICLLLKDGKCSVESAKPRMCADFKMNGPACREIYCDRNGGMLNKPDNKRGGLDRIQKLLDRY